MKETIQFTRIINNLNKVFPTLPGKAATIAVNFSKDRFRDGAWLDSTKEKWKPRKYREKGKRGKRQILVDTGRLKRSIYKQKVTPTYAIIAAGGTGIGYAQIHNDGGRVQGSFAVPAHARKAHTRQRKGRLETVRQHTVKAHTRKVNFIMPRRQFIGASATLDKRIQLMLTAEISRALKTI